MARSWVHWWWAIGEDVCWMIGYCWTNGQKLHLLVLGQRVGVALDDG